MENRAAAALTAHAFQTCFRIVQITAEPDRATLVNRAEIPLASPDATPAADVLFVFRGGREELAPSIIGGLAPDEFLYGFPEVRAAFPGTAFIEADRRGILVRRLFAPFEKLTVRLGFGLFYSTIFLNRRVVAQARVIVATTDGLGVPFLILKRLGLLRAEVVMVSQGLHSIEAERAHLPWVGWLHGALGRCIERAAALIALGEGDAVAIRRSFAGHRRPEIVTIQFGIDHAFWQPAESAADSDSGYVLSVGSDQLRDYPTLISAIGTVPLRLVTRLSLPAEAARPTIQVLSKLEWPELRALYQQARFVVTPVRDQPRDSGHSATLQAMACGKAVIFSDTEGLWDRENMRHGETCWLVKPGDPAAMREAISHLWAHPEVAERIGRNARQVVIEKYSSAGFGTRLAEVVRGAMKRGLCEERT